MSVSQNDILISVSARTDVGRRRSGNEDSFLVADVSTGQTGLCPEVLTHRLGHRGSLFVVSDGMGGAAAGEVASAMAVQILLEEMARETNPGVPIAEALRRASEIANQRIWEKSQSDMSVRGLGATLTASFVHQGHLYVSQVGDSRAYIVRGRQIKQITEDQSWANAIKKTGVDPRNIPNNVILQALGTQPHLNAEVTTIALCRGDFLLLCSDGLSNKVQDLEMQSIVLSSPSLEAACRALIDLANERGGEDNITVIVVRFDGESLPVGSNLTITQTFNVLPPVTDPENGTPPQSSPMTALLGSLPPPSPNYSAFPSHTQPQPGAVASLPPPPTAPLASTRPAPAPAPAMAPQVLPHKPQPVPGRVPVRWIVVGIGGGLILLIGLLLIFFAGYFKLTGTESTPPPAQSGHLPDPPAPAPESFPDRTGGTNGSMPAGDPGRTPEPNDPARMLNEVRETIFKLKQHLSAPDQLSISQTELHNHLSRLERGEQKLKHLIENQTITHEVKQQTIQEIHTDLENAKKAVTKAPKGEEGLPDRKGTFPTKPS
ncbi:MAG: serine/threonine-protein phosphatase [Acidobacteria bacterium]|nr:serine/threonine-protein phosphatase [Acidobacteriota bacterium]